MIYTSAEVSNNLEHISLTSTIDLQAVTRFVNDVVASAFPGHVAQGTDDLFGLGLNSLQAMEAIKLLKAGIRSQDKNADISWITMRYTTQPLLSWLIPLFKPVRMEARLSQTITPTLMCSSAEPRRWTKYLRDTRKTCLRHRVIVGGNFIPGPSLVSSSPALLVLLAYSCS